MIHLVLISFLQFYKTLTLPTVLITVRQLYKNEIDRKGVVSPSYLRTVQCIQTR